MSLEQIKFRLERASQFVHQILSVKIREEHSTASIGDEDGLIESVQEAGHQLKRGLVVRGFSAIVTPCGQVRLLTRNSIHVTPSKIPVPRQE